MCMFFCDYQKIMYAHDSSMVGPAWPGAPTYTNGCAKKPVAEGALWRLTSDSYNVVLQGKYSFSFTQLELIAAQVVMTHY